MIDTLSVSMDSKFSRNQNDDRIQVHYVFDCFEIVKFAGPVDVVLCSNTLIKASSSLTSLLLSSSILVFSIISGLWMYYVCCSKS